MTPKSVRQGAIAVIAGLITATSALGADDASGHFTNATSSTTCGALNRTENGDHSFFYLSVNVENVDAMNWARTSVVDPTDVNTRGEIQSLADVVVEDADYSTFCGFTWHPTGASPVIGLAKCNSIWTGPFTGFCNQHGIYLDTSYTSGATATLRQMLSVHEIGHTLGANHETGTTVMVPSLPAPTSAYGDHVLPLINAAF